MEIKEELGISRGSFANILHLLRSKKIIHNGEINPMFIPDIDAKTKNFKIIFNFNIING